MHKLYPISPINHGHNMWKPPSPFPVGNYTPSTLLSSHLKWAAPSLKCQLPVCVSTGKRTSCSLIFQVKKQIETVFLFSCLERIKKENLGEQENVKEQYKSSCLGHKGIVLQDKQCCSWMFLFFPTIQFNLSSVFIFFLNDFREISYNSYMLFWL